MIEEVFVALGIRPMQILIQIAGFLLVFGLLSKLLWKPVLDIMDAREKEVKDTYAEADKAKAESEKLAADYKSHLSKIEEEAQQKLAEAVKKGTEMGEEIVADARKEAEQEKEKALNAIKDEARKARIELRDFSVGLSMDIAEKVLEEQVDKEKHEALVKKFLSEMESMN